MPDLLKRLEVVVLNALFIVVVDIHRQRGPI